MKQKREKHNLKELLELISEGALILQPWAGLTLTVWKGRWQGPLQKYTPTATPGTLPLWIALPLTSHSPRLQVLVATLQLSLLSLTLTLIVRMNQTQPNPKSPPNPNFPHSSGLYFSFSCLLSPEAMRNNFNPFIASPSSVSFSFCKIQILRQFNHLPGYWEVQKETIYFFFNLFAFSLFFFLQLFYLFF